MYVIDTFKSLFLVTSQLSSNPHDKWACMYTSFVAKYSKIGVALLSYTLGCRKNCYIFHDTAFLVSLTWSILFCFLSKYSIITAWVWVSQSVGEHVIADDAITSSHVLTYSKKKSWIDWQGVKFILNFGSLWLHKGPTTLCILLLVFLI